MAKNAGNIGNGDGQEDEKFQAEVYEQLWSIPDWERVQRREDTLTAQTFEFQTGRSTRAQTKWLLGFKMSLERTTFRVFWKLIDVASFPKGKVELTATCSRLNGEFAYQWTEILDKVMCVGEMLVVPRIFTLNSDGWGSRINPNGELAFKLKLTIMEPKLPSIDLKMERFHKTAVAQLCVNFGNLLGDQATADLTIETSDGNELLAHKAILKAQCTVFDSMFRSDMSESKTGTVIVKDVSSKTMEILLHFFYTGNLLQSWKDEENVVEFTYAVGKYQLTNVLNLLDEVLGTRDEEDATNTDIQLLDLVQKLGLKTAEKELLERIKRTTSKVNSGVELFALYGIKQQREIKTIDSKFQSFDELI